jgi:hypothetical protein
MPRKQARWCSWCGAIFVPETDDPYSREQDYCSRACAEAAEAAVYGAETED